MPMPQISIDQLESYVKLCKEEGDRQSFLAEILRDNKPKAANMAYARGMEFEALSGFLAELRTMLTGPGGGGGGDSKVPPPPPRDSCCG